MDDSILNSIKKLLGIEKEYEHFNTDVIIHINSAISTLTQIGVGPSNGFSITGDIETWRELIGERGDLEFIKSYIYLKVKLVFDPPSSSAVIDAIKQQISELEWRIQVATDPVSV